MSDKLDLVISNVHLIDPANSVNKVCSIGVKNGLVAEIDATSSIEMRAAQVLDMSGFMAMPGIIDSHVHVTSFFGGSNGGLHMLAKAGVCTALDLAGPLPDAFSVMQKYGSGINLAVLESVRPGENISGTAPDKNELQSFITSCLKNGAIGAKLLGGHFPLTPEASGMFVAAGREQGAYVAWHAGTTETCNTVASLKELLELSAGHFVHVAHINSYCRGMTKDAYAEVQEAFELLEAYPKVYSEAYLSESNGTTFAFNEQGRMKSNSTGRLLEYNGFENSVAGLEQALLKGFARLFVPCGLETVPIYGEEAVKYWHSHNRCANGGFAVNPALPRAALCMGKFANGDFRIDAISTDGGSIPRNVAISHGLALVKLGAITLEDFVRKTSYNPSRMLRLQNKGHLAPGADADITLVDLERAKPHMTMCKGQICMLGGVVTGKGGTMIVTHHGVAEAKNYGLPLQVVDYAEGPLPFRKSR